jgi:hypothetical protein
MYPIGSRMGVREAGSAVFSADGVGCVPVQAEIINPLSRRIWRIRFIDISLFIFSHLIKISFQWFSKTIPDIYS